MSLPEVSEIQVRVNYSETDQMGVVYHAALPRLARRRPHRAPPVERNELPRAGGGGVEAGGLRHIGAISPAREFDDVIRVRCWVRDVATRRVEFGYAVEDEGRRKTPGDRFDRPHVPWRRHATEERSRTECGPRCGSCPIPSGWDSPRRHREPQSDER